VGVVCAGWCSAIVIDSGSVIGVVSNSAVMVIGFMTLWWYMVLHSLHGLWPGGAGWLSDYTFGEHCY